ncbi:hypothetical protein H4219_002245 [Mycoemilia scoparia]|uniref:Uncharacterized protein n=1 Tax=Mycoemilia scoparia TaxID=417184 RepID=A0A9W8DV04_9FUNG|nr:hypothetical protein H4219_002245 [Mycoemilia scoparia]
MANVRVATAFRPFPQSHTDSEMGYSRHGNSNMDSTGIRRANTTLPLSHEECMLLLSQERVKSLSTLQQQWFPCEYIKTHPAGIPAPMPQRHTTIPDVIPKRSSSVPERSGSPTCTLVDVDAACMELRGIFGKPKFRSSDQRPGSSSSQDTAYESPIASVSPVSSVGSPNNQVYSTPSPHPLLEIVIPPSPISRCDNPAPRDIAYSMSLYGHASHPQSALSH